MKTICEYQRLRALLPPSERWLRSALKKQGFVVGLDGKGNVWPSEGMLQILVKSRAKRRS